MKKIIFTTFLFTAFTFLNAQTNDNSDKTLSFGVKGGVNFSNIYTRDIDDDNVLTSFHAGFFVTMPIAKFLSIQPELLYSRKGSKLVYDNDIVKGVYRFKLNYIEMPVLLKINITKNFNIHAGPYVAYLIDSSVKSESSSGNSNFEGNSDNDDFNRLDYGLSTGLGFDFGSFGIGARYNYGLATVGKDRNILGTNYAFPDGKNSNLSIYAAYKF